MADYNLKYGNTTSLTVTGLAALGNGNSATSATVDNTTTLFIDALIELTFTTFTTVTATGTVEIWAKGSIDNTDFDDDLNDRLVGVVVLTGTTQQTRKRIAGLAAVFGGTLPPYWQLRIRNATGGALTAGAVSYRGATLQSV